MQIAICDDEKVFRVTLREILVKYKAEKRIQIDIYEFESGEALLRSDIVFDIVFMDYQMPGPDGMETSRILRCRNSLCSLIFITAYPQFILESFAVQPFWFMVKPACAEKVYEALDHYISRFKQLHPIVVVENGEQKTLDSRDIIYLEGDGKYCIIRTNTETARSSKTLSQVHSLLPQHCFVRIHKSYVINMYFVASLKDNTVTLTNGEQATVGRKHIAEFKKAYMSFLDNNYLRM